MSATCTIPQATRRLSWRDRYNGPLHKPYLQLFFVIVLAHWAEHLCQAFQIYVLGWPIQDARGIVGLWLPWVINSETLHYAYALVMLAGLWMLRPGFAGASLLWWTVALWIQFWHHIEHAILQTQYILNHNLLGGPIPLSILQLVIPRVELHLFYNSVVFIPMLLAMFYHIFPTDNEARKHRCSCARGRREA